VLRVMTLDGKIGETTVLTPVLLREIQLPKQKVNEVLAQLEITKKIKEDTEETLNSWLNVYKFLE